jgi:hypothetical protein
MNIKLTINVGLLAIQPTDTAAIPRTLYGTGVHMSTVKYSSVIQQV